MRRKSKVDQPTSFRLSEPLKQLASIFGTDDEHAGNQTLGVARALRHLALSMLKGHILYGGDDSGVMKKVRSKRWRKLMEGKDNDEILVDLLAGGGLVGYAITHAIEVWLRPGDEAELAQMRQKRAELDAAFQALFGNLGVSTEPAPLPPASRLAALHPWDFDARLEEMLDAKVKAEVAKYVAEHAEDDE